MMSESFSRLLPVVTFVILVFAAFSCSSPSTTPKVLVFSKTAGYEHASIDEGNKAIMELGAKNGFTVDTTTNAHYFTDDSLKSYAAVIFLSTTQNVLNHYQEAAFERYIQAGGGYAGIHAASDTEYGWGWYGRLVGAYFRSHPSTQQARLEVIDQEHSSTQHLPETWVRTDEWYNFKELSEGLKVLITIDEESYEGGENGNPHPIAWYHEYDGGRAFYTALGHTEESFSDSLYLQHLLGGIQYAMGANNERDYSLARTPNVPEEDRFVKTVLTEGTLYEPTEMTILPNLDVLIAQRRGEIMLYKEESDEIKQVGYLDVYHSTGIEGVNAEEGIMGIAADPNFVENSYVYVFYSSADTSVNRLSRFVFRNSAIEPKSEQVILQFYSQRQICCHTGGSIAFGPDGLLYLSTGDNSTPFNEPDQPYANNGFAPLDDRPGHEQYDARRTSANTNDLRGKIIRIRLKEDGSYEIPEGNLFPADMPGTRPEIYTMGHRNPYRIAVDQKNSTLYWGEVGPDAANDSLETRGVRGYDEVGQAREAGNFGWPLFVGDNYAYRQYNYATGKSGAAYDPVRPLNNSRNNTGIEELPAARPAFIWYPYAESPDFPELGAGGRNAMAGPVYYPELYPRKSSYPAYYKGKLFIYDWVRDWVKVVSMQPNGSFDKIEPFMESTAFASPIDMEVGPDGRIYVLEYGKGWFAKNPDSGLSRIDYLAGNRPPKIHDLTVDKMNGGLPFTVTASVEATDPENDQLMYFWSVGKAEKMTREPRLKYVFVRPGDYPISVKVIDTQDAAAKSKEVRVYAGNEQPKLEIALQGNRSFYFSGVPVKYQVQVSDEEAAVDQANLYVSADYIYGKDLAGASQGHQRISETMEGKNLMLASDCSSCHKTDEKSAGPSFRQVAGYYQRNTNAVQYLSEKIVKGGSGVWGENAMPAHLTMDGEEAKKIAKWILTLAKEENKKESLAASGEIIPAAVVAEKAHTVLRIAATYTDQGGEGARPLSGSEVIYLKNNRMDVSAFTKDGISGKDTLGSNYLVFPADEGWIKAEKLSLKGIESITLEGLTDGSAAQYRLEVRTGRADGKKIGETLVDLGGKEGKVVVKLPLQELPDEELQDVYVIFRSEKPGRKALLKTVHFVPAAP